MQEVDRFATNHKKQIGKLEIHFATIAYWAGKCCGNEVSVPVHRTFSSMCSSWLPAQQKLKIIWHHAFCCWLHPWSAMCPPFSNFDKTLAASSKDMQSVPKGQKETPIWKENCCCRVSKRKTQQNNRTESAFFFLLN
jgi:hypothetical protein